MGLDEERRAQVERLLIQQLDNPDLGQEQKTDLTLAALAWDGLRVRQALRLVQQVADVGDLEVRQHLAEALSAVSARLAAKDAAPLATILVEDMKRTNDFNQLQELALSAVSARLEAKDAAPLPGCRRTSTSSGAASSGPSSSCNKTVISPWQRSRRAPAFRIKANSPITSSTSSASRRDNSAGPQESPKRPQVAPEKLDR